MTESSIVRDATIYQEMMSHPALFAHGHAKNIVIIGDERYGVLSEILKHPTVVHVVHSVPHVASSDIKDKRVDFLIGDARLWLTSAAKNSFDVIIVAQDASPDLFKLYLTLLNNDGILVQQSRSLFDLETLKALRQQLIQSGYTDVHVLNFHQQNFTSGWRTALLAKKHGNLKRPRERDVYNKGFLTRYYNFDIHKASLVLPEFMREELEPAHE